ncbi:hypothetical protein C0Q70_12982 [Pomacea canaliculata]|uniref:Ig-like domain-containing protein n=1 Tax=Pomacea canaliculata TaxID=400727 RepID=A0A2T7P324_POMCA|nr:hypothetical protein C0Q70_12982 [Pomacea canaliculata]
MVINPVAGGDASLYQDSWLLCQATRSGTTVGKAGCRFDYIHASEDTSCTVQFRNDTWSVYGQCNIQKAYSVQNRYRCEWIQTKEVTREEKLLANVSMSTVSSVGIYVNGSCNFTSYLPPNGQYTYYVTVVPGEVQVTASFIGSNVIRRPSGTPYHNCPQYVQEGGAINCKCFISDLGSPPGKLQWNTTLSSELRLPNVQQFDYGTYTCQLLWNNTVVQSVEYVLKKGYSAKVPIFNINSFDSKTVNVDEKSHVEMRCYSDGKPTPSSRLINAAEPSQSLNHSQPADDDVDEERSGEVSLSIHQVQCQVSGVYRCEVNNSIGQDSQSRTLLVSCAPRRTNIDGNPPTVNVRNGSGVLTVNMTAYPTPQIKTSGYLGTNNSSDGLQVKENSVYASCSTTLLAPASVTCNVIVINMTHNDEGFYKIVFSNSLGDLPFTFFVKVSENDQQAWATTKTDENIAGIVVLAVMLSVVVVLILVTVIWVWRRGWTLPCADRANQRNTQQNQRSGVISEQSLTPVTTETSGTTDGRVTPLYDALQMKDVGMRSHYEGILRQQNVSEISSYEGTMEPSEK